MHPDMKVVVCHLKKHISTRSGEVHCAVNKGFRQCSANQGTISTQISAVGLTADAMHLTVAYVQEMMKDIKTMLGALDEDVVDIKETEKLSRKPVEIVASEPTRKDDDNHAKKNGDADGSDNFLNQDTNAKADGSSGEKTKKGGSKTMGKTEKNDSEGKRAAFAVPWFDPS
jgi:hypothetical protein